MWIQQNLGAFPALLILSRTGNIFFDIRHLSNSEVHQIHRAKTRPSWSKTTWWQIISTISLIDLQIWKILCIERFSVDLMDFFPNKLWWKCNGGEMFLWQKNSVAKVYLWWKNTVANGTSDERGRWRKSRWRMGLWRKIRWRKKSVANGALAKVATPLKLASLHQRSSAC